MEERDIHPVAALLSGLTSTFGRTALAVAVMATFMMVPLLPSGFTGTFPGFVEWVFAAIYSVFVWAHYPFPFLLAAFGIPVGMVVAAWGFVGDHRPLLSLWSLASLSMLLTGPFLFVREGYLLPLTGILLAWSVISIGLLRIASARGSD